MKRRWFLSFLILQAFYPACVLLGCWTGREFRFVHDILCLAAVTGASAWLAVSARKEEERTFWAMGALALSLVHAVTILLTIFHWTAGFAAVGIIVCGWIVFDLTPRGVLRVIFQIPTILLTLLLLLVIPVWFLVGTIGSRETVRNLDSPDGRYTASVISIDQGALGGDTLVEVTDRKKSVNILIGRFTYATEVYRGDWGDWEDMDLSWEDTGTLTINGTNFSVTQEKVRFLTEVADTLGISLSGGIVLDYRDSHGGFHGDGTTFAMIRGTCSIPEGPYWHRLPATENVAAAIEICVDENNDPLIPRVQEGWYYFYDRHPESRDPADDAMLHGRNSRNFTVAVYDADTNILYHFEYDS